MKNRAKPSKSRLKTIVNVALAFVISLHARAEETSVMSGCTTKTYDANFGATSAPNASCDGGFKTFFHTSYVQVAPWGGWSKEVTTSLSSAKTILNVFVLTEAGSANHKFRVGTSYIWIGENSTPFSVSPKLTARSTPIFDSGFYKLTAPTNGVDIVFRRQGGSSVYINDEAFILYELRAYQSPNLLLHLQGTATISAPAPSNPIWAANNLITNLGSRSAYSGLPAIIDGSGNTANFNTCYQTDRSVLAVLNHQMVLTIDLVQSYFQHAILFVQDFNGGFFPHENASPLLENVRVFVGDDPDHTKNVECAGGPFMVESDPKSFVNASYDGYTGLVWKFGREVWCNLQGQFLTLVSDMSHRSAQAYRISLCHLSVFGTVYVRTVPVPTLIQVLKSSQKTFAVEKIKARSDLAIGNTLNIMLRQKAGTELSWVTFTQGALETTVNLTPDNNVAPGDFTLVLESFDQDGGVFSALKTDRIIVRILPVECGQPLRQTNTFESSQPIAIVREYAPTIFFPSPLFSGPNTFTFTGQTCGGTYSQTITMDSAVAGVDLSSLTPPQASSVSISSTAAVGTIFTLTFNGRYVYEPTSTDFTASFTQRYLIKTVFSIEFLDQPTIAHSMTASDLTFRVPPALLGSTPPTYSFTATFAVAYPIKTAATDSVGNTPPAVVPVPYTGFSSASLVKLHPSLGTTSLTSPQGSLRAEGFTGDLVLGGAITFTCDAFTKARAGKSIQKPLVFKNTVEANFQARVEITCLYEVIVPPRFTPSLEPVHLTANQMKSWTLPIVTKGTFSLDAIRFEPDAALAAYVTFVKETNTVTFNGDLKSLSLTGHQLALQFTIIDAIGVEVPNSQAVIVNGCQVTESEIAGIQANFTAEPLRLQIQAAVVAFKSLSYKEQISLIKRASSYDAAICGNITVDLVSKDSHLQHDAALQMLTLFADTKSRQATFSDAYLKVSLHTFTLKITIEESFVACMLTSLAFAEQVQSVTYKIGSGSQAIAFPAISQKPNCNYTFNRFAIDSIESPLTMEKTQEALALKPGSNVLVVATDDAAFIGQTLTLIVKIDQTIYSGARPLIMVLTFTADPPAFDLGDFEVKTLTCSVEDAAWSQQLPSIVHAAEDPVKTELLNATDSSNLFQLKDNQLSLKAGALSAHLSGPNCLDEEKISFSLALTSQLLGSTNQTITVPIKKKLPNPLQKTASAGADDQLKPQASAEAVKTETQENLESRLLIAKIKLSPAGELTIKFSSPILKPAIRSRDSGPTTRRLDDETAFNIEQVVDLRIKSDQDDELDKSIAAFTFVRAEEASMTLQIYFSHPRDISPDIGDPDTLELLFLIPQVIINARTGAVLHGTSWAQSIKVAQQYEPADFEKFQEQAQAAMKVGVAITIWELLMFFFFQKILFSMWVLILTLQLLVYMSLWQIRYPQTTHFMLYELKRIVLGEFIDDFQFGKKIASAMGVQSDDQSSTEEKLGRERLGSLFGSVGVTVIVITVALMVLLLIIVAVLVICKRCAVSKKGQERLMSLKQKVFWGPFIRFAYLNALKLNLAGLARISSGDKNTSGAIEIAIVILCAINTAPLLFCYCLKKNRDDLDKEATRMTIGALYQGKNVGDEDHKAHIFPLAFFIRRTAFMCVTVFLFEYPSMQMLAHNVLTLLTVCFLAFKERSFCDRGPKFVEIGSECLLLATSVFLAQLNNKSLSHESIDAIDVCAVASLALLLFFNLVYVVVVAVGNCKDNARRKALLKRMELYEKILQKRAEAQRRIILKPQCRDQKLEVINEASQSIESDKHGSSREIERREGESSWNNSDYLDWIQDEIDRSNQYQNSQSQSEKDVPDNKTELSRAPQSIQDNENETNFKTDVGIQEEIASQSSRNSQHIRAQAFKTNVVVPQQQRRVDEQKYEDLIRELEHVLQQNDAASVTVAAPSKQRRPKYYIEPESPNF